MKESGMYYEEFIECLDEMDIYYTVGFLYDYAAERKEIVTGRWVDVGGQQFEGMLYQFELSDKQKQIWGY